MALAPYTRANRDFFAAGCAPTKAQWKDWVRRGVVAGKEIDGVPYIDINKFASRDQHGKQGAVRGIDLLS